MARRAPDPVVPASPPKRVTRARTRTTAAKEEANNGTTKPVSTTPAQTTAPKRGRPKKDTGTAESASKVASRTKLTNTTTNTRTNAPKRRAAPPKTAEFSDKNDSSEDEVNVVTVRNNLKARVSKTNTALTTAPQTKKRGPSVVKNVLEAIEIEDKDKDEDDDDDDELAQPGQQKPMAMPSRKATTTTRKGKTETTTTRSTTARARKDTAATRARASKPATLSKARTATTGQHEAMPSSTSLVKNRMASSAPKKKVTFLDATEDSDKENQPLHPRSTVTGKFKAETGLKAKPVRRPATPLSREEDQSSNSKAQPKKEPLSPKKPNQLVKQNTSDISNGDKDAKDQMDTYTLPKTPQRQKVNRISLGPSLRSPAKKLDFTPSRRLTESSIRQSRCVEYSGSITLGGHDLSPLKDSDLTSPAKKINFIPSGQLTNSSICHNRPVNDGENFTLSDHELLPAKDSLIMSTPARRIPQSPFKGSIKESPRKVPITFEHVPGSRPDAYRNVKTSPLKESARRVKSVPFFLQGTGDSYELPAMGRKSLLKSPAKRLMSPSKSFPSPFRDQSSLPTVKDCEQDASVEINTFDDMEIAEDNIEPSSPAPECMDLELPADKDFHTSCELEEEEVQQVPLHSDSPESSPDSKFHRDVEDPFLSSGEQSCVTTPVRAYEIGSGNSSVSSVRHFGGVPPPVPSPPVFSRDYPQFAYRGDSTEPDSDAESMMSISPSKSPAKSRRQSIRLVEDSDTETQTSLRKDFRGDIGFTPLADKLSQWKPADEERRYPRRRGMFSLAPGENIVGKERRSLGRRQSHVRESHGQRTSFMVDGAADSASDCDDEVVAHQHHTSKQGLESEDEDGTNFTILEDSEDTINEFGFLGDVSRSLTGCAEDENILPEDPTITVNAAMFEEHLSSEPRPEQHSEELLHDMLPMSVTPVRSNPQYPRVIHTVSKVPLKAGDGPLNVPRKRTRSFSSGANSPLLSTPLASRSKTMPSPRKTRSPLKPLISAEEDDSDKPEVGSLPERPKQAQASYDRRKSASPRKQPPGHDQVLRGTVIFTDVHTKEGADASGIFVELLTQMGARCVKSWNWNPRSSLSPVDGVEPRENRIGVTHVIFKDGGVRTLEKVREASGVVKCVGVNWVLE